MFLYHRLGDECGGLPVGSELWAMLPDRAAAMRDVVTEMPSREQQLALYDARLAHVQQRVLAGMAAVQQGGSGAEASTRSIRNEAPRSVQSPVFHPSGASSLLDRYAAGTPFFPGGLYDVDGC